MRIGKNTKHQRKGEGKTKEAREARAFVRSDNSFDVHTDNVEMEETNVNGHVSASHGIIVNATSEIIVKVHVSASQAEKDADA
jgi:hypothetical protein